MRESAIERYLHTQVEKAGGTTRKFKSPGRRNVPDRIVIWPERAKLVRGYVHRLSREIHFVELKAPGEKLRPAQERERNRLAALGCQVFMFNGWEQIDAYVWDMTP